MSLRPTNGDDSCVAQTNQGSQDQTPVVVKANLNQTITPRSIIGKALFIKGDIGAKEDIQINGKVEGTIAVKNNRVEVGVTGHIDANIFAKYVVISGEIKGDVYASEQIIVTKSGRVYGNIHAADVSIEYGALLKGSIDMEKQDILKQHVGPDMHDENHKSSAFNFLFRKNKDESLMHKDADMNSVMETAEEVALLAHECSNNPTAEISIIGESVMIKGEMISEEDVMIQGGVEGTICCKNNSLRLGPHSFINANIFVKAMIAQGEIKGDIYASEQVVLRKPGHITGTIHSPGISIDSGAVLMGGFDMEQQDIEQIFSKFNGSNAENKGKIKPAEKAEVHYQQAKDPASENIQSPNHAKEGWPIFYPRS